MLMRRIEDWDDAYANMPNIPDGEAFPARWEAQALRFRAGRDGMKLGLPYGKHPREKVDLFLPDGTPKGLLVFVHGGYWMRFGREIWSHLAGGPLSRGWAVAMPSYPLCPELRIGEITQAVGRAITMVAELVMGPMVIAGHSAGGHLACRMMCREGPIGENLQARTRQVVSISGVHDLRPLLRLELNETLGLDQEEAYAESPVLREPVPDTSLITWVGAAERGEFIRQSELLANAWIGLGAATTLIIEPDRHHFDVIDGLADPESAITAALVG